MIVGTAGHIDHGKTTLVRTLTGVDTDRLAEEKARGISIDLGYAYLPLGAGGGADAMLGFVDVPGHERFVHTMVAGASGIDFALLVVAADDGVMPQTREHVAILDLLGASAGAVAIGKADRVEPARIEQVRAEVVALLAPTRLQGAPVFAVDARDANDAGMRALRAHLVATARARSGRDDAGFFRLAVDRVFSLAGHGTVVTGTVHAGRVATGDAVVVMPSGIPARVRGLHAQNREASTGHAGQRCALNLAGIEREAIARGDWIADARAMRPSSRIDVRLRLIAGARVSLVDWTPLHVHVATAHRLAHAVPLGEPAVDGSQRAQLVFDAPVCASGGDRFVVRDAQARATVGGGVVIDPQAPARRRRGVARLATLDAIERLLAGEGIAPLLRESACGIPLDEIERRIGHPLSAANLPEGVHRLGTASPVLLIDAARWQALRTRVAATLAAHHAAAPDEPGVDRGRLRRMALPDVGEDAWRALVAELLRDGVLACRGPWLHLPAHRVELSADERALVARIEPLLLEGGNDPPWVRDLAVRLDAREDDVRRALRKCAAEGRVHQVVRDLFYPDAGMRALADVARDLVARHGNIGAATFRDAVGLGRKRAIQVLEFFDRAGYTLRVRDLRVLRADAVWGGGDSDDG